MKIYHHNDLDGRCAGAIALRWAESPISYKNIETAEIDYKDKIDVDKIQENERVVIVDFSFKPEVMEKVLKKTKYVTWIDHHKTAFEYRYSMDLAGIRDEKYAGCELAWMHFRPLFPMPRAVELIGDYDKWALKFQPQCFQFYEGLKLKETSAQSPIWDRLFEDNMEFNVDILNQGISAIQYRDNYCSNIRKGFGYEVNWNGYKAYATNFYQFGSKGFGEKFDQYDFCIAYIHDGKRFTVSLYSEKIDVSIICKEQGGGGHKGAAGFVCDQLPFLK